MGDFWSRSLMLTSDRNNIYYKGKQVISTESLQMPDKYVNVETKNIGEAAGDLLKMPAVYLPIMDTVNISLFRNRFHGHGDEQIFTYAIFKYIPIICGHYIEIFKIMKYYKYLRLGKSIATIVGAIIKEVGIVRVITDTPFLVTDTAVEVIDINSIPDIELSIYKYKQSELSGIKISNLIPGIKEAKPTLVLLSTNKILTYLIAKEVGGDRVIPVTIITSRKVSTREAKLL